jgi:hypothetical protein
MSPGAANSDRPVGARSNSARTLSLTCDTAPFLVRFAARF